MALDTSIALNAKAPELNPLQQALQVAQFRAYNANGQAAQQGLDANRAISAAYQQATDPTTGQVDNNRLMALISQNPAAGFKLGEVVQGINTQKQQQQTLAKGDVELNDAQRKNYAGAIQFLTQQFSTVDPNDPNAVGKIMQIGSDAVQQGHITPAMFKASVAQFPDDPKQWPAFTKQKLASFQDPGAQLGSITPKPTLVDDGMTKRYLDTNAISNPGIVGTTIQNQLSPESATAPVGVMGPGNTPGVVPRGEMWNGGVTGAGTPQINVPPLPTGANPQGAGQAAPMPGQAAPPPAGGGHFVATGMPAGAADSISGNVDTVNKHWASVSNDANNAQANIGLAQNIKAYAQKAATGKQGDKLAAANGLLSVFGIGGQTDLNTATDLLQKNMARLSLTSRQSAGGTDAAGALATAANPHGSMTMKAIEDAADQVIGSQKMVLAQQQLLQPYKLKNDVVGYQTTLSKFNQAADPRVWQFQSMTPEQRSAFKAGMSPADQKAFGNKIRTLEGMGAIQ